MDIDSILSFNPNKVKFISSDGKLISVEKYTTEKEFEQISRAHKYLSEFPIALQSKISFFPAPVMAWDCRKRVLTTKFCQGDNLEILLKTTRDAVRSIILLVVNQQ